MVKLLIVGWDGASIKHTENMELEYFDQLEYKDRFLPEKLYQGMPVDSGYAWTSISTGLEVEEHGIISLNNVVKSKKLLKLTKTVGNLIPSKRLRTYFFYGMNKLFNLKGRIPRSTDVPYKRLWDYWNGNSFAMAVPMTYPAWKQEEGSAIISGIPGPTDGEKAGAYPLKYEEHRKRFDGYYYLDDEGPLEDESQPRKQEYVDAVYKKNEAAVSVTKEICGENNFELVFAVFPVIDDLLHAFDPENEEDRIEKAYRWMDEKTQELVEELDPDNVLVISDHGMMDSKKSLNFSLPGGVLMDHDSMNGLWASNKDFDLRVHSDLVPNVLDEFGYSMDDRGLEMVVEESSGSSDEEEIKKRLERMGYRKPDQD